MQHYVPPANFGLVEEDIYRSGQPNEVCFFSKWLCFCISGDATVHLRLIKVYSSGVFHDSGDEKCGCFNYYS